MRSSAGGAQSPFPVKPATREDTRDATSRVRSPGVYSSFGANGHRAGHTARIRQDTRSGFVRTHGQDSSGFVRFRHPWALRESSRVIRVPHESSGVIRSHQGSSGVIRGHQESSGDITHLRTQRQRRHHTLPQKSATVRLIRVSRTMLRSPNSYFSFPVILHT